MRPYSYNSSQFSPDQLQRNEFPPLPECLLDSLRMAFQQLDKQGNGLVPVEFIIKNWPKNTTSTRVPQNFLSTLHRICPSDGFVTFQHFLHAAQLALWENYAMTNGNALKRVQSEGKLLAAPENGKSSESTKETEERERPKSRTSTPAMGISGRKLDAREYGRLLKMKKASRSQPQLNELFNDGMTQNKEIPRGLRRTSHRIQQEEAIFNMKFVDENERPKICDPPTIVCRKAKPKSIKAPPPVPIEPPVILPPNGNGANAGNEAVRESANYARVGSRNPNNNNNGFPQTQDVVGKQHQQNLGGIAKQRPVSVAGSTPSSIYRTPSSIPFQQPPSMAANNYAEELQPQVSKHERLLEEEFQIVNSGVHNAQELLAWYEDRLESLEKRKRMLHKGMVALDSAVHEQKLNFHRAQIAEMNRRIKSFLSATERGGFPSHGNSHEAQQPIRNQVLPPPFQQSTTMISPTHPHNGQCSNTCSATSSSSNASSASGSLPLDGTYSSASEAEFLRAQNQKLMRDIRHLAHEVEKMRMQNQRQPTIGQFLPSSQMNGLSPNFMGNGITKFPNWPGIQINGHGNNHHHYPTPKDTLL